MKSFGYIASHINDFLRNFWCEINTPDIDEVKTGELLNAYNSYFEDKENSLFDIPIVFSLWKVNKNNNNITHDTYYDKFYFDENLEKLSVQEMIRYIATKKF